MAQKNGKRPEFKGPKTNPWKIRILQNITTLAMDRGLFHTKNDDDAAEVRMVADE